MNCLVHGAGGLVSAQQEVGILLDQCSPCAQSERSFHLTGQCHLASVLCHLIFPGPLSLVQGEVKSWGNGKNHLFMRANSGTFKRWMGHIFKNSKQK